MKTGRAEGRFILHHDVGRDDGCQHLDLGVLRARLHHVTHHGRLHLKRNAFLQAKTNQRLLFPGIGRKGIEIEHGHAGAVIRQNDRGAPFALAVRRRELMDVIQQNLRLLDVVVQRGDQQHAWFEARESRQRGLGHGRKRETLFGQLEGMSGRRILKEIGERHWLTASLR